MNTKLTLNINRNVIEEAKSYAKKNRTSVSKLIENYLDYLTKPSENTSKISPLVESLTGVIPSEKVEEHSDYKDYLNEKYA